MLIASSLLLLDHGPLPKPRQRTTTSHTMSLAEHAQRSDIWSRFREAQGEEEEEPDLPGAGEGNGRGSA